MKKSRASQAFTRNNFWPKASFMLLAMGAALLALWWLIGIQATAALPPGRPASHNPASPSAFPGANGKIAFARRFDGQSQDLDIALINADGTGLTRLTDNSEDDKYPVWSPDGTKIVFLSGPKIHIMNADGSGQIPVFNTTYAIGGANWSPDGTKIVFSDFINGNMDIYTINLDGTGLTRLTTDAGLDLSPSWSPDGTKIAFVSGRAGGNHIYVMNADGTGQTQLTTTGPDISPDWSPDGAKIAFNRNIGSSGNNWDVFVMDANGANQTNLTINQPSPFLSQGDPSWSPDGTKIVYRIGVDTGANIYLMNADGSGRTAVSSPDDIGEDITPDWQPLQSGNIVIVKDAAPEDDTVFTFTHAISASNSFTLQDPANNSITFNNVPVGSYTVTEQALSGWTLHDITCNDSNSSGDAGTGTATINLEADETVTCTYNSSL